MASGDRWLRFSIAAVLALASFSTFLTPLRYAAAQQAKTIIVPGSPSVWVDSGVYLNTGDTVSISATDSIYVQSEEEFASPDGIPDCTASGNVVLPGAPCWSLVAHINEGDVQVFEIGSSKTFTAQTSGELWLGQNADSSFEGNSGQWEVTVTWSSAPAPVPPPTISPSQYCDLYFEKCYGISVKQISSDTNQKLTEYLWSISQQAGSCVLDFTHYQVLKDIVKLYHQAENVGKPIEEIVSALPYGSCIALPTNVLEPGQLQAIDECIAEAKPIDKGCRDNLLNQMIFLANILDVQSRDDLPVNTQGAKRTLMWGPAPFTPPLAEPYVEGNIGQYASYAQVDSTAGHRLVIYFDKGRLEITHADGDANSQWYVTSGLLAKEMITGQLQMGDNTFEQLDPAQVNVAGDLNDLNGPTYASFNKLMGYRAIPSGWNITQTVDRAGNVGSDSSLADYNVTATDVGSPSKHTVASVFWDFMNSTGPIDQNGQLVTGKLFANPFYATGYPLTEAYWTHVLVGGVSKLVLVQVFERRVMTYTPSNGDGWQVEAGNVGLQYYQWRYGGSLDQGAIPNGPWFTNQGQPIASNISDTLRSLVELFRWHIFGISWDNQPHCSVPTHISDCDSFSASQPIDPWFTSDGQPIPGNIGNTLISLVEAMRWHIYGQSWDGTDQSSYIPTHASVVTPAPPVQSFVNGLVISQSEFTDTVNSLIQLFRWHLWGISWDGRPHPDIPTHAY